ncbi:unnamed protein product [Gongylonema pulchrum]|uniref:Uncharacterized protein n=1 Tax=Gongylonema pulchrum TaxID=637853 RepID=A0A183DQG7_9BILA|nr:unnamed protein product [Gongylonema pulchrum]
MDGCCWNTDLVTQRSISNLFSLLYIARYTTQSICFQCSDLNIEVHYGAFFINPRILQDGDAGDGSEPPRCDSPESARIKICRDPCFILNVTTQEISTSRMLPFGTFFICSLFTSVLDW